MKRALVCGAGGFIGSHMVKRLKKEGYWVRGVDLKKPEFSDTQADDFVVGDLRDPLVVSKVVDEDLDELYQFAADMGGAGYIFTTRRLKRMLNVYFIPHLLAYILNTTSLTRITQIVVRKARIQQTQTVSMGGKNFLVRDYICLS